MKKVKIALLIGASMRTDCIAEEDMKRLRVFAAPTCHESDSITEEDVLKLIAGADGCLTGWGTPSFTGRVLRAAPNLKIIAHSAGTVKGILEMVIEPIKEKGIKVTSAAPSLGIGVAEFTLGMMLVTMKRAWWYRDATRQGKWRQEEIRTRVKEPYQVVIGIIGASNVGRHLIKLLKPFEVTVLVFDPYFSDKEADNLGVEKVGLEDLMRRSDVVSLHAPSTIETRHMLNKENLNLLKDGAVFINTARGAIVNESDLIAELKTGRITACLDVTDPEPPASDSPLRQLPNVILTPHIAGAIANARLRNGHYAVTELERFFKGKKVLYPVNLSRWNQLA